MCLTVSTVDTIAAQTRRQKESSPQAWRGFPSLPVGCIASLGVMRGSFPGYGQTRLSGPLQPLHLPNG